MLVAVAHGNALTLGRMQGEAIVGQPLEVAVAVQLDTQESAASLCIDADVFHADARLEPGRVKVSVDASPQPQAATVRISSSTPVDEPIVTVYLKAGCGQKSTRRYVLLADFPSERGMPLGDSPAVAPAPLAGSPVAADRPVPRQREPRKPPTDTAPPPISQKTNLRSDNKAPRLKLDSLVMLAERVASPESSPNVPVAEVLRDSQTIQTLQSDLRALVALAAINEANLMAFQSRLEELQSERLPADWFYPLMALLAGCLAAMAYFLKRQPARPLTDSGGVAKEGWWSGSRGAPLSGAALAPHPLVATPPSTHLPLSVVEAQAHGALRKGPLPAATVISRPQGLQMEQPRFIDFEELFDIRQQADFFVSLGQTDQAVRILENRIIENGESSPLIYLDLLKILHTGGLKNDFRQFREDFNLLFNSKVPEFSEFNDEGKSLEDYPHVLAHIVALWATPKALSVIEAAIFRDPWDDESPPFELAAFRDLLLLHGIAQGTVPLADAVAKPDASHRAGQLVERSNAPGFDLQTRPGSSSLHAPRAPVTTPRSLTTPVGVDLHLKVDLDLDLTEQPGIAPSPAHL